MAQLVEARQRRAIWLWLPKNASASEVEVRDNWRWDTAQKLGMDAERAPIGKVIMDLAKKYLVSLGGIGNVLKAWESLQ